MWWMWIYRIESCVPRLATYAYITQKHFLHNWLFVRGIQQSRVHYPQNGPAMPSFDMSFYVTPNTLLNELSSCQWFETLWRPGGSSYSYSVAQYLWGVITCPCPWYLPQAQRSWYSRQSSTSSWLRHEHLCTRGAAKSTYGVTEGLPLNVLDHDLYLIISFLSLFNNRMSPMVRIIKARMKPTFNKWLFICAVHHDVVDQYMQIMGNNTTTGNAPPALESPMSRN